MNRYRRVCFGIFIMAFFVFLIPFVAGAGLMRIDFTFSYWGNPTGLGYMQFEDVEVDTWYDIDTELSDLQWHFTVKDLFSSKVYNGDSIIDPTNYHFFGSILIEEVAQNAFVVRYEPGTFTQDTFFEESESYYSKLRGYDSPDGFYGGGELHGFYAGETFNTNFTTSVWFDDPPPQVPIPASALLLVSALLPMIGIKKWRRK